MFTRTLSDNTAAALAILGKSKVCNDAYLAGGTALALYLGHRVSVDLDFFSKKNFDSTAIVTLLKSLGNFEVQQQTENTINGLFNQVKFSYFQYPYQQVSPNVGFRGIKLAGIQDIAAMKLAAITDRGTKKDYIDLYFLAHKYTFDEMFGFYEHKYHLFNENQITILKSLTYFFDADESEMPVMIEKIEWGEVKKYFLKTIPSVAKKVLELE